MEKTEPGKVKTNKTEPEEVKTEKIEPEEVKAEKTGAEEVKTEKAEAEEVKAEKAEHEEAKTEKAETKAAAAEKAPSRAVKAEKKESGQGKKADAAELMNGQVTEEKPKKSRRSKTGTETGKARKPETGTAKAGEVKTEEPAKTGKKEESARTGKGKTKRAKSEKMKKDTIPADYEKIYRERYEKHQEELRWLYMELYDNGSMYAELTDRMEAFFKERAADLKEQDRDREAKPDWYKQNDLLGMMLYIDNFAGNIKGVQEKLDYIEECNVNYIHLMPFLDTTEGKSDGGYAVSDFRKVQEKLGTMEDLEQLTAACHRRNINVCMDFVMNHTSEDHEWAKRARAGEGEYMSRYFFFDNWEIPSQYERTVPQVFPTTAPGNFTWLPDAGHFVMTTFYPYQWDLNYRNPRVFNEMMYNFLYLANRGIDIIRIDAVPYIWKELGTSCRNLQKVHTIVRMMRIIGEIVCPSILLLGEVVMEPEKVVPYFGTIEKPECHMLYNVTTMATTWHTVATRDVRLLKKQLDILSSLPKEYVFLNYLRCHDDIGWGLDYATLWSYGMGERAHKQYLNDYFQGYAGNSVSRGELYNADPVTGDARFCGTTASMCGIEKAEYEQDQEALMKAVRFDLTLHAYMFMQSGIPVLYSGDELAQLNDYTYKDDPNKAADSRYIHRGKLSWEDAEKAGDRSTVPGMVFQGLRQLEEIRRTDKAFVSYASTWTLETWDQGLLCMGRYHDGSKILGLFNFTEFDKTAWINEPDGLYEDMFTGEQKEAKAVFLPAYGFTYLKKI